MSLKSTKKPTLLLVDDDSIIADSLEYVLNEEYQVNRAFDRLSSFKVLSQMDDSPTLALVDLGLPPDTHTPDEGLAVIRKIAQMHPSTRVLVLSGQDNKKHIFQAKESGAVDFISKPCDIAEIKVRLKKQIKAAVAMPATVILKALSVLAQLPNYSACKSDKLPARPTRC